jgi:hypothetical protein
MTNKKSMTTTNPIREQGHFALEPINALEAISRAEIDIQIATAKKYPRSIAHVKAEMLDIVLLDEETAGACFYSLPRGGKNIQGPSIRLAEIALSCFGNVRAGSRIIELDADGKFPAVTIQAVCHDLQKNVAVSIEKRRRIVGKKSHGGIIDEDDINLAANAASAIALRDAIFKVVPGALIRPVFDAARKVAIGDARTLSDRRQRAIEAFTKMGVSIERVLASVGKTKVDEINLEDLEVLLGMFTAIKEGTTTIESAFPPAKPKEKKVEKPDFTGPAAEAGSQSKPPSAESSLQPPPAKEKGKAKTAEKSSGAAEEPPSAAKETTGSVTGQPAAKEPSVSQQALYAELKSDAVRGNFLEGLKQIDFPGVPADAEVLSELDDATCTAILERGVAKLFEEIRDHRWSKDFIQP